MAGTSAVQTWHSNKTSKSSSSSSQLERSSEPDAFEKKLTAAKVKQAVVTKPAVVQPPKKSVVKPIAGKPAVQPAEEPQENSPSEAAPPENGNIADPPEDPATPVATKPAPSVTSAQHPSQATEAEQSTETTEPAASGVIAPIDPEAGNGQPRSPRDTKPKASVVQAKGSPDAAIINPLAQPPVTDSVSSAAHETQSTGQPANPADSASADSTGKISSSQQIVSTVDQAESPEQTRTDLVQSKTANTSSVGDNSSDEAQASAADTGDISAAGIDDTAASPDHSASPVNHAEPVGAIGINLQSPATLSGQPVKAVANIATTPQARFVEENHPKIVTGISGQLMPKGGVLQLRLDPPGLGAMQITVRMRDGAMTAAFETSNDDATRMLSHSLGQLKTSLETAGMSVEKLQVQQAPKRDGQSQSEGDSHSNAPNEQQQQAQQEKQRREVMQRMWAKLAGTDPLDTVA